jgi:hypothetical protein
MLSDVLLFLRQSDVSDDSEIFVSLKTGTVSKTCLADKLKRVFSNVLKHRERRKR